MKSQTDNQETYNTGHMSKDINTGHMSRDIIFIKEQVDSIQLTLLKFSVLINDLKLSLDENKKILSKLDRKIPDVVSGKQNINSCSAVSSSGAKCIGGSTHTGQHLSSRN